MVASLRLELKTFVNLFSFLFLFLSFFFFFPRVSPAVVESSLPFSSDPTRNNCEN